jgi:hypothetical protein
MQYPSIVTFESRTLNPEPIIYNSHFIFPFPTGFHDPGSISARHLSRCEISDHQQSWGYEEGPSKGPWRHALLVVADLSKQVDLVFIIIFLSRL